VPSGDAEGAREPMTISLEIRRPPKASSLPFISRKSASPVGNSKKYYTICRVSWRKNFGFATAFGKEADDEALTDVPGKEAGTTEAPRPLSYVKQMAKSE
jgi:hypothetical protein